MNKFLNFLLKYFSSQIHHWICFKLQSILKYKLENVISKFQYYPSFCKGVAFVRNSGSSKVVFSQHCQK